MLHAVSKPVRHMRCVATARAQPRPQNSPSYISTTSRVPHPSLSPSVVSSSLQGTPNSASSGQSKPSPYNWPSNPALSARALHTSSSVAEDDSSDTATKKRNPNAIYIDTIRLLLDNLGSWREVKHWLKVYSSVGKSRFAVVKVGGGVLTHPQESKDFYEALAFMTRVGLFPVILHGGGPQTNDELRRRGIVSDYHNGIRVTTGEILTVARKIFAAANMDVVMRLQNMGTTAASVPPAVFRCEYLDKEKFGLVGDVKSVDLSYIDALTRNQIVPVVASLGETADGQILNINADVAAKALAQAIQPLNVIYINQGGGIVDGEGNRIAVVNVPDDLEELLGAPWCKYGTRLKVLEIASLIEDLQGSSVTVTSPENLVRELFSHHGGGTLFRRSMPVKHVTDFSSLNKRDLTDLLETTFGRPLSRNYFEELEETFECAYVAADYNGVAIITRHKDMPDVPYLDKFAVRESTQGTGVGEKLWARIVREHPKLYWRSLTSNALNTWYLKVADACIKLPDRPWSVFWYGFPRPEDPEYLYEPKPGQPWDGPELDFESIRKIVHVCERIPSSWADVASKKDEATTLEEIQSSRADAMGPFMPLGSVPVFASQSNPGSTMLGSGNANYSTSTRNSDGRRYYSSSTTGRDVNVGILGARGYVGMELLRLLGDHPSTNVVLASSRALKGVSVREALNDSQAVGGGGGDRSPFADVIFCDTTADDISNGKIDKKVDVWFLALPNGHAKEAVAAIDKVNPGAVVIDLSADYRFDCHPSATTPGDHTASKDSWIYGFAERNRPLLKGAKRISNPGCYATTVQAALLPFSDSARGAFKTGKKDAPVIQGPVSAFCVSGYSGAGTTPSPKTDPKFLNNNLIPYSLVNHIHEREISKQMGENVRFFPHVGQWFRGITATISVDLDKKTSPEELFAHAQDFYRGEKLLKVLPPGEVPLVKDHVGKHGVRVGGFFVCPHTQSRAVLVSTSDNLLKGAATQAIQNLNLALGYNELTGLPKEE